MVKRKNETEISQIEKFRRGGEKLFCCKQKASNQWTWKDFSAVFLALIWNKSQTVRLCALFESRNSTSMKRLSEVTVDMILETFWKRNSMSMKRLWAINLPLKQKSDSFFHDDFWKSQFNEHGKLSAVILALFLKEKSDCNFWRSFMKDTIQWRWKDFQRSF